MILWKNLVNNNTMRYGIKLKDININNKIVNININNNKNFNVNDYVGNITLSGNINHKIFIDNKGYIDRINYGLLTDINEIYSPYLNVDENSLWLFDLKFIR